MRKRRTTPSVGHGSSHFDEREPLVWFRAERGLSFKQVVAALEGGLSAVPIRVMRASDIVVPGLAFEIDDAGIMRVRGPNSHDVIYLVSKGDDATLYGEFF